MSANEMLVLDALTDEPQTRHQIAELTGLERAVTSTVLSGLKARGEASNAANGWTLADGKQRGAPRMDTPNLVAAPPAKGRGYENGAKKAPRGETVPPRFYRGELGDLLIDTGRPGAGSKRMVLDAEDVDRLRRFLAK